MERNIKTIKNIDYKYSRTKIKHYNPMNLKFSKVFKTYCRTNNFNCTTFNYFADEKTIAKFE